MKKRYILFIVLMGLMLFPVFCAKAEEAPELKPVYAYWSKLYSYRYFSISGSEQATFNASSNWKKEGIFWYAYEKQAEGASPIFKFKNTTYNYYYFTASESIKNQLMIKTGWTYKGIAFYAYASEKENTVPVYTLKNSKTSKWFYTSSPGEKKCILASSSYWTDRGIAFWVPSENANVSEDETSCNASLGPEISVGLWKTTRDDAKENAFKITANRKYAIKDRDGKLIANIPAGTITKVKYSSDKKFRIYNSIQETLSYKEVLFEASDGRNDMMIFDVYRTGSDYDQYRGKIKIRYTDSINIWVINTLPMEHYVWGMGETTGTGPIEHTKVMTTIFRTYGYWYIEYATKYLPYGFKIRSDSGSQIYRGYDWEIKYPNIKKAALGTRGMIATYGSEIALTPYSSWSDGRTRSFEERWGSNDYPWCRSVKDPYGKHPTMTTSQLVAAGNHMVGLVGNGSVKLASKYLWSYSKILKYYYYNISLKEKY